MQHWKQSINKENRKDGFLFVHGKTDGPHNPVCGYIDEIDEFCKNNLVDYREYPWGYSDPYSEDFLESMKYINDAKKSLIEKGATHIHVLGHSLGCTAILLYATQVVDISSLIMMSPGHNAHLPSIRKNVVWSIAEANRLIEEGNDEPAHFIDFNNGMIMPIKAKPSNYLSYFHHDGPGSATNSAITIKQKYGNNPPFAMVLVSGTNDMTQSTVKGGIWDILPKNKKTRYIEKIGYDHFQTVPFTFNFMPELMEMVD